MRWMKGDQHVCFPPTHSYTLGGRKEVDGIGAREKTKDYVKTSISSVKGLRFLRDLTIR